MAAKTLDDVLGITQDTDNASDEALTSTSGDVKTSDTTDTKPTNKSKQASKSQKTEKTEKLDTTSSTKSDGEVASSEPSPSVHNASDVAEPAANHVDSDTSDAVETVKLNDVVVDIESTENLTVQYPAYITLNHAATLYRSPSNRPFAVVNGSICVTGPSTDGFVPVICGGHAIKLKGYISASHMPKELK